MTDQIVSKLDQRYEEFFCKVTTHYIKDPPGWEVYIRPLNGKYSQVNFKVTTVEMQGTSELRLFDTEPRGRCVAWGFVKYDANRDTLKIYQDVT